MPRNRKRSGNNRRYESSPEQRKAKTEWMRKKSEAQRLQVERKVRENE